MSKDNGGAAFPNTWENEGMTLRDYFAAAALQGMYGWFGSTPIVHEVAAKIAYETADAMLKERQK